MQRGQADCCLESIWKIFPSLENLVLFLMFKGRSLEVQRKIDSAELTVAFSLMSLPSHLQVIYSSLSLSSSVGLFLLLKEIMKLVFIIGYYIYTDTISATPCRKNVIGCCSNVREANLH
jgi:hypothetical protein